MKVYYGLDELCIESPIVTMGSFDGLHLGHLIVINRLKQIARDVGGSSVVVTFDPHPREIIYPNEPPIHILTTIDEKIKILESKGVDNLIVIKFDKVLASMPYEKFIKDIIVDKIGAKALFMGYDNHMGKDRKGSYDNILKLANKYGFEILRGDVLTYEDIDISSTKIRKSILDGKIGDANTLLGYPYSISGEIVHGDKIGRQLGYPTANIKMNSEKKILPPNGVYASRVHLNSGIFYGMLNIGFRPTINTKNEFRIEVNIFDFDKEIYGENIRVEILFRLRGEQRFQNKFELSNQLSLDEIEVRNMIK